MCPKDVDEIANSVDPDQSDLGLHCLPYLSENFALSVRKLCPTCPKTLPYLSENFALSVRKLCPTCPKTLPYLFENFALPV